MLINANVKIAKYPSHEIISLVHNLVLYSAADVSAKLFGGDTAYIPSNIGFVYAPVSGGNFGAIGTDRGIVWEDILDTVRGHNGNIILCPILPEKTYSASATYYTNNRLLLSAITDKSISPLLTGTGFASNSPQPGTDAYYQAIILSRPSENTYIPIAYTNLQSDGSGIPVTNSNEYHMSWAITIF